MIASLAAGTVLAGASLAAATERYRLERSDSGYVRMDTQTGEMSTCEERGGHPHRRRIRWLQPEQEAAGEAAAGGGEAEAYDDTNKHQQPCFTREHRRHAGACGAQGYPDTDLVVPSRHHIGQHAVESERDQ